MITLDVNGKKHKVSASPDTPLLWVLREELMLTGTKFGCGEGICGACTVHVDGETTRSCITSVGEVEGAKIVTIEGLPEDHPVKRAWLAAEVSQCGYCQPGQIMEAVALLRDNPAPSDSDIDDAMSDNLCRCGTYPRIRKAIHQAAAGAKGGAQ
jgi:isoquinoline 1-oxidoreductase alpha subunit